MATQQAVGRTGEAVVYDPHAGEIRGHRQLRRFVSRSQGTGGAVMAKGYSELPNELVSAVNRVDFAYRDTGGGEGGMPRVPHAQVKIYPDAAHGFLFQHHAEFAADVEAFLTGAS